MGGKNQIEGGNFPWFMEKSDNNKNTLNSLYKNGRSNFPFFNTQYKILSNTSAVYVTNKKYPSFK